MDGKTLQAQGLCKTYGKTRALDGGDADAGAGAYLRADRPQRSRQDTLLAALTAQLPVDTGTVTYGGEPVWENESALGDLCFSRELSGKLGSSVNSLRVREYLKAGKLFYPHWDAAYADRLMAQFGLDPKSGSAPCPRV